MKNEKIYKGTLLKTSNLSEWKVGNLVAPGLMFRKICHYGGKIYMNFVDSKFVCIREATASEPGVLVKVLNSCDQSRFLFRKGEPFVKDYKNVNFESPVEYCSFRLPTVEEIKFVLSIAKSDKTLGEMLSDRGLSPYEPATYWTRDISRSIIGRHVKFYDSATGEVKSESGDDTERIRITVVYFTTHKDSYGDFESDYDY
ncbi:MAG: hypothetical protein K5893_01370 [Prevotella sp.]|nr:hypothetical protein [Prevotella sp.]